MSFFDPAADVLTARAPGRLDVMGGIADYSGSLVLQLPLAAEARVDVAWDDDVPRTVTVCTTDPSAAHGTAEVRVPLESLFDSYAAVRERFARNPEAQWAAYVAGSITVLHRERGVVFLRGVRWLVRSEVPAGKGVSSSAAIEVAAMRALADLLGLCIADHDLALLCQKVENLVVGAPCGVMDQMTAACGRPGALMALLCQPAEVLPPVAVPDDVAFYGIDSGIRHQVSGADYASVRAGAFMGYRVLLDLAGLDPAADSRWRGYLANVTPEEWVAEFRDRVPERMTGADFLDRYGGTTDALTVVDRARTYAVRAPTAHPIHEHDRVREFRSLLVSGRQDLTAVPDATLARLGELMYASHDSYNACGLGSDGTDALVALVRDAGPAAGLFGAKITGGGSGGTVAVLGRAGSRAVVEEIARRYSRASGRAGVILD